MCGGPLDVETGTTVIEREYCGTTQTLPKLDDDRRVNSHNDSNCCWWMRSPGLLDQSSAAYVNSGGDVGKIGYEVNIDFSAVGPALWIDLNS